MMAQALPTSPEVPASEPFSDPRQAHAASDLGMWVFLTSETLFFGVLFFAYLVARLRFPDAFAAAGRHTDLVLGTANTAVLLTSSLMMALSVRATGLRMRRVAAVYMAATVSLGLVFLAIKGFEYRADYVDHLVPSLDFQFAPAQYRQGAELFFWLYFVMTGFHAVHVSIGILLIGFFGARLAHRGFAVQTPTSIEMAGLYWHYVDIVWIFLYPSLYLIARS